MTTKNAAAVALGKLRGAQVTKEEAAAAGRAAWADVTAAQRSAEMRRRRRLGIKRAKVARG